jgi:PAS domain S-box-containing protein
MDPALVDLTRRIAAGDPAARAELAQHPGEMARALDEIVSVMERRTALLAETEQYFDALAQQSLVGIYVASADRILFANETIANMTGYRVDEIVGRLVLLEVVHPEDRATVSRNFERRFRGETFRATFRVIRKDGGIILVETDGRRVLRRGEPVIIGTVVVVDNLKRGRTEARRQRQALFRSERMATLGELLGGLAHELDHPLTGTAAQAKAIEEMAGPGPVADRAHKLMDQAQRAGEIVRRFTAMVHDYPQERSQVGLNDVVRDVVELFEYSVQRTRITLVLELAEPLPPIWADAHRLRELVANLIANALQAMRGRPAPRRLTIQTLAIPETRHVAVEVSDTGPGVSAEARARLFEPFFSTKPAGVGTGLGLFVCLEIAREHRGSVALVDRMGPGATFRVELPERAPDLG